MEKAFSMVGRHVKDFKSEDKIFAASREAGIAAGKFGKEKVINATVGAILDDNEKLAVLDTVMEVFRQIPAEEVAAYAPIAGTPDFIEAAIKSAFKDQRPEGYIRGVATPGGSGALRHAVWNYSNVGDAVLTSDWYWGPYKTIAEENLRRLETFTFFDREDKFDLNSFSGKVRDLLQKQESLVILLNSPAHNCTGFALSDQEWEQVIAVLKDEAKDKSKKIILVSDIAYIDYAGEASQTRQFMRQFSNLSENILVIVAFSISKALTMYGLRTGAVIGISNSENIVNEFFGVCQNSNRGTWSNGNRSGMKLASTIINDAVLSARVEAERERLRLLLEDRARIFINEARQVNLDICPYKAGFFVTIKAEQPDAACALLKEDNIFPVAISGGIRFAVCSVPAYKLSGVAEKIKKAVK